ncbi:MAG: hypothetical protein KDI44_12440 [Thiothrix sp.]|nr:hypothetical protein [Thiothrix sp.]HPQ96359.1 hypothetical protein [Thiolinea sp.]
MMIRLLLSWLTPLSGVLLSTGSARAHSTFLGGGHAHIEYAPLHLLHHSGILLLIGLGVFFISRWLIRQLMTCTRKHSGH